MEVNFKIAALQKLRAEAKLKVVVQENKVKDEGTAGQCRRSKGHIRRKNQSKIQSQRCS